MIHRGLERVGSTWYWNGEPAPYPIPVNSEIAFAIARQLLLEFSRDNPKAQQHKRKIKAFNVRYK